VQLAPPVHGASMMNGYLTSSRLLNDRFNLKIINLQFNKSLHELKKFSLSKVFKAFVFAWEILKQMFRFKPDLVYFTLSSRGFAFYRDAFYVFLVKRFHTKIIFHLHSKGINKYSQTSVFKRFIYRQVFKNTESICLASLLTFDIENVSASTPYIIPCGIPVTKKTKSRVNEQHNPVPQILFLSNFIETKGILIFVEALGLLKEKGDVFNARLVGAPADITLEMLANKIKENNLSDCTEVIGPLYDEKKNEEYQKADLFVFPTFYENEAFPLVLLEALQYGIPVISTFEGGIPEMIINNETGLLVQGQDPQLLADSISNLIRNPESRKKLGANGFERFINNYTLEHFENKVFKTFSEVLSKTTY
jgi:glycosyltransferase involved in cell wall biosynthesis